MSAASFTKKAWWRKGFFNTANFQDTVVGGVITNSPANYQGSQLQQTLPGDRVMLGPLDAFAVSNNAVGNLFVGSYRYLQFRQNSTANPKIGCALYWDPTVAGAFTGANISNNYLADTSWMVTPDGNAANFTNTLIAAIAISNISQNNGTGCYWWAQESGKATLKFINVLTGTGAIGSPVFAPLTPAANNNATDNGAFDVLAGGNSGAAFAANSTTAYTQVGQLIQNYMGVAEVAPSNNNLSIVDLTMQRTSFRIG